MGLGNEHIKGKAFEHCHHDHPVLVRREMRQRSIASRRVGNRKPMRFVSLHHHSTFSYLDGYGLPEAHIRRAEELQMSALAMTEHGNIASHVKLEAAAEQSGVKPIYGCEIYTGKVGPEATQRKNHLTVLAKNDIGYRNLMRLVSLSNSAGFYYEPTVDWDMLNAHKEGLIVLSGCTGSALFTSLVGGKHIAPEDASYARGKALARRFKRWLGDAYYLEVQAFPELEITRRANHMIARIGRELGIPLVATLDCHYTVYTESEIQQVLHNIRPGERRTLEEMARDWGYDVQLCPPPNDRSVYRKLRDTGLSHEEAVQAVVNTELIAQECNVTLPKLPMVRYPSDDGRPGSEVWRDWLEAGWAYRKCDQLPADEQDRYRTQLRKEVAIIEDKDFTDYFLIVSDAVRYAKDHGIVVGPARGSAAASLACWLLRITEINPMLFPDLVFERFIDVSRADLPDIDLDFDSDRRHEVREYLVAKYGAECVSNIGTFTYFKSKLALDDVARVHRIPKHDIDVIKGLLLERSSGDLRASATIEDTVSQFDEAGEVLTRHPEITLAMDLEGNVKQFGVHSAGLVISNGPISDVTAVINRTVNGHPIDVVSMDKYDAERQGLLKLDFLGLSTMALLAEALRQLGMTIEQMYDLPLDDEETIQGFRENDVVGIFQFEGRATRSVCGALRPDTFKEICDVNALSRPGPLHNGAAFEYINIKRGASQPELIHPLLEQITAPTNYQIVYQEQILRIVTEIGGFDWTAASYIRRIISKKYGEQEFNRQWERFWDGAQARGVDQEAARKIWGMCITAGSYAFNAAHSTSYGLIAYWTMWLKRHHPAVFYAASLSKTPRDSGNAKKIPGAVSIDRHSQLLRDAVSRGIRVLPPSPRRSRVTWYAPNDRVLRAGLSQISGIGQKTAEQMIEFRRLNPVKQWDDYLAVRGIGPTTIAKVKEFTSKDDPFDITALDRRLAVARDLVAQYTQLPNPTHTALEVPYESGEDVEIVWIGLAVHLNLRDIFESNRARTGEELDPSTVKNPELNEFMLIAGYDGTETVNLRYNRFVYPKFKDQIWKTKLGRDVVLVRGYKPGFRTAREIYVQQMWVIDPED